MNPSLLLLVRFLLGVWYPQEEVALPAGDTVVAPHEVVVDVVADPVVDIGAVDAPEVADPVVVVDFVAAPVVAVPVVDVPVVDAPEVADIAADEDFGIESMFSQQTSEPTSEEPIEYFRWDYSVFLPLFLVFLGKTAGYSGKILLGMVDEFDMGPYLRVSFELVKSMKTHNCVGIPVRTACASPDKGQVKFLQQLVRKMLEFFGITSVSVVVKRMPAQAESHVERMNDGMCSTCNYTYDQVVWSKPVKSKVPVFFFFLAQNVPGEDQRNPLLRDSYLCQGKGIDIKVDVSGIGEIQFVTPHPQSKNTQEVVVSIPSNVRRCSDWWETRRNALSSLPLELKDKILRNLFEIENRRKSHKDLIENILPIGVPQNVAQYSVMMLTKSKGFTHGIVASQPTRYRTVEECF